ncbi:MAG TPA: PPOX class F420-dependent oxidoreductase [Gaiellales bacterium]
MTAHQEAFLRDAHLAVVTTLRADGSPHSTVVWIDAENGDVLVNTARGRAKERHLLGDPRVSVLTLDAADAHRWLLVEGRATLEDEGAGEHIDALALRYQGPDTRRISEDGPQRVIARIRVERVEHEGLDEPLGPDESIKK